MPSVALVIGLSFLCLLWPWRSGRSGTIKGVTPWQKRARLVMAAVAIGVIAVVAYTMRPRETVAPPPKIERLAPDTDDRDQGRRRHPVEGREAEHPHRVRRPDHQPGRREQAPRRQDLRRQPRRPQLCRHRQGSVHRPAEQLVRRARRRQARDQRRPDREMASRPPTSSRKRSCASRARSHSSAGA